MNQQKKANLKVKENKKREMEKKEIKLRETIRKIHIVRKRNEEKKN